MYGLNKMSKTLIKKSQVQVIPKPPIKVKQPLLKVCEPENGMHITLSNRRNMSSTVSSPLKQYTTPVKQLLQDTPNTTEPSVNVSEYKYVIAHKIFQLHDVKKQSIDLEYKLLTNVSGTPEVQWNSTLPDVPLLLEIKVARATVMIHIPCVYMEKTHKKVVTQFRRATDVREYHDTYIPTQWNMSDVCFYLRTLIFNYIVDSNPLSDYRDVLLAISWKYDILSSERLSLISGGKYEISSEDTLKLKRIEEIEKEYVL